MKKTKNNYVIELNEIYPHYEPFMEYLTIKSNKVRNMLDKGMYGNVLRNIQIKNHPPLVLMMNIGRVFLSYLILMNTLINTIQVEVILSLYTLN